MQTEGFGRLSFVDSNDTRFRLRAIMPETGEEHLAQKRHYRVVPTAPLDQGSTSSCVGHACHHFLMAAPRLTRSGPSPFFIYRAAQRRDEWPGESYNGTSVRAGLKVLQEMEYISEYRWTWTTHDVRCWMLAGHGTIILGTNWYADMMTPDKHGFMRPTGRSMGGHAYLAIGADKTKGVRILNSWSRKWGDNGRAWLSWEHLELLLQQEGEAAAPIETPVTRQIALEDTPE